MNEMTLPRRRRTPMAVGRILIPEQWWNPAGDITCTLAAYNAAGAVDYGAAKVNLADPGTYNLAEGAAPYWELGRGFIFRKDLGSYLNTGIVPTSGMTTLIRVQNCSAAIDFPYGAMTLASATFHLAGFQSETQIIYGWGNSYVTLNLARPVQAAVLGLAGDRGIFNGQFVENGAAAGGGSFSGVGVPIYLGAVNYMSTGTIWSSDVEVRSFAAYSCILSAQQVAQVAGCMMLL